MSNANIAFRSSFRGYNKKDVYKYLDNLNRDLISKSNEYEIKERELLEAKNVLESKLSEAKLETEQTKKELEDTKKYYESNNTEKDTYIEKLKNEIAKKNEELSVKDSAINALEQELSTKDSLIDELDSAAVKISIELDNLSDDYKALLLKYQELSSSLVYMEELKRKANAYDKISERVKQYTKPQIKDEGLIHEAKTVKNGIKNDINDILSVSAEEILEQLKETQARFNSAIEHAQKETDQLKHRIGKAISTSKEKIISQINK